jgi:hypothetical protein
MPADYEALEEACRQIAAALGIVVVEVVLNDRRGRPRLIHPIPPPQPAVGTTQNVPLEILKLVRSAGKPLTGLLIFEGLIQRGVPIGKSTLDHLLAKMVSEGDLANPPGVKPAGYRLPTE